MLKFPRVGRYIFMLCSALWLLLMAHPARAALAQQVAADLRLSHDGQWLAGMFAEGDAEHLGVLFVGGDSANADQPVLLPYQPRQVHWHAWVGSSRLLFAVQGGGLVLYDVATARLRPLIETNSPKPDLLPPLLLAALRDDGGRAILQWEDPANPGYPAVYEIDIPKATSRKIISGFRPIVRWLASADGEVGGGIGYRAQEKIIYGPAADGSWRAVWSQNMLTGRSFSVSAVGAGAVSLVGLAGGKAADAPIQLASLSLLTGTLDHLSFKAGRATPVLAAYPDPISGVTGAVMQRVGAAGLPVYHSLNGRDRLPMLRRDIGDIWLLVDADHTGLRGLYISLTVGRPIRYQLVLDDSLIWRSADKGNPLYTIAHKDIKRPDGSALPTYISQPEGAPKGMLLLLHGGPHAHVSFDYDPVVARAVARGLLVYQPDFIGSSGYSDRYRQRGMGAWGRVMQRDVDTVAAHMRRAYGRRLPLLVAGGSYGGMSALLAVLDQPQWYDGALVWSAVTDLRGFYEQQAGRRLGQLFAAQMRGPYDPGLLARRAPLARPTGALKVPVMMLHGAADTVVPVHHMQAFASRHPAYVRTHLLADTGHDFTQVQGRRALLAALDEMISEALAGD